MVCDAMHCRRWFVITLPKIVCDERTVILLGKRFLLSFNVCLNKQRQLSFVKFRGKKRKKQLRRKLAELTEARNKILVQGGRFNVNIFIAYIVESTGTILAVLYLW